jgi:calcineurin-like phosphoesterase family protein
MLCTKYAKRGAIREILIWFTSDLHLGHKNVLHLCERPFQTVQEMDAILIKNWNDLISKDDEVYVLGDFAYRNQRSIKYYVDALNGTKHLILGNHDKGSMEEYQAHFESVDQIKYLTIDNRFFVLFHYPILSWARRGRGSIHLYGHVHRAHMIALENQRAINVGVDTNNFKPLSLNEIITLAEAKPIKIKDAEA